MLQFKLVVAWLWSVLLSWTTVNEATAVGEELFSTDAAWPPISTVQSMARIVVPKLRSSTEIFDHDYLNDDSISAASRLWRDIDYQHWSLLPPQGNRDSPYSSSFSSLLDGLTSLRLHLEVASDRNLNDNVGRSSLWAKNPPSTGNLKSNFKKTGTTIAGCVVDTSQEGPYVILAADTRATENTMVADKTCSKIHPLASNCWCCGAGTSGDLDKATRNVLYSMALQELQDSNIGNGKLIMSENGDEEQNTLSSPQFIHQQEYWGDATGMEGDGGEELLFLFPVSIPVICQMFQDMLYRAGEKLGVNLILGGVWHGKAYLRAIHPHGSMDVGLPFAALGSGGLAAMAVLEDGYSNTMTLDQGIQLVQRAVVSGIRNDLGSGSQVDLCIISPDGSSRHTRQFIPEEILEDTELETSSKDSSASDNGNHDANRPGNVGVDGFGNIPFAVDSTRQRVVSSETSEESLKSEWDKALGL